MPELLADPSFWIFGALLGVVYLVARRQQGDGVRKLVLGLVAIALLWTGVSWASTIGTEAVLATLAIAVGFGIFEWTKRLGER